MGFGFGMGFNQGMGMFNTFGITFTIVFVLVIGMFIVIAVKGIGQWNKNNHSPRLTVPATVVAKRTNVSHHRHGGVNDHHTSTSYYVTFQVESGDWMELHVAGTEYGVLIEGDSIQWGGIRSFLPWCIRTEQPIIQSPQDNSSAWTEN